MSSVRSDGGATPPTPATDASLAAPPAREIPGWMLYRSSMERAAAAAAHLCITTMHACRRCVRTTAQVEI